MTEETPVFCKTCQRVIWSTHIDADGNCCFCHQPKEFTIEVTEPVIVKKV